MTVNVIRECNLPIIYHPAPDWVPNWLVESIGVDFFCRVASVDEQPVANINRLKEITRLNLLEGFPTASIPTVFPNLKMVTLRMDKATASDLEFLTELDNLEVVLASGNLGAEFPTLPRVRSLFLTGSAADCQAITSFPNLTFLNVYSPAYNHAEIARASHLQSLFLGQYDLFKANSFNVGIVSQLEELRHLSLKLKAISGLESLRGNDSLEYVQLHSYEAVDLMPLTDVANLRQLDTNMTIPEELRAMLKSRAD